MATAPATTISTTPAAGGRATRPAAVPAWLKAAAAALCSLATCQALAAPVVLDYTGSLQTFTVQTTGIYTISAAGAQGGYWGPTRNLGGGAEVFGDFMLTAGTVLNVVVGGMGYSGANLGNGFYGGGGGGGSFIYTVLDELLLVAGGGGGSGLGSQSWSRGGAGSASTTAGGGNSGSPSQSAGGAGGASGGGGAGGAAADSGGGGGGAGWAGDGSSGADGTTSGDRYGGAGGHGPSDFAGGAGSSLGGRGGFGGGGGGGLVSGGGGGGYSGGGGGGAVGGGGGGSSFFADDAENIGGLAGVHSGHGSVRFDLLLATAEPNAVPEPGSLLLAAAALGALAWLRRRRAQGWQG